MNTRHKFRSKVKFLISSCHEEIKKTTSIGKKMLSASKTNTDLHQTYEELGNLAYNMIKSGELEWNHRKVHDLVKQVDILEEELAEIEEEVKKLKVSSGPEDISTK